MKTAAINKANATRKLGGAAKQLAVIERVA
jgi:hypothetical protein